MLMNVLKALMGVLRLAQIQKEAIAVPVTWAMSWQMIAMAAEVKHSLYIQIVCFWKS